MATVNEKALEAAANRIALRMEMESTPRSIAEDAVTTYLASITGEHGELVERLCAASGILKKHPSEVYFGSQLCLEAADTITALSASNAAHIAEIARLREALIRSTELLDAAGKAISEHGYAMDFTHVDGVPTDHIGFSIDCENAVQTARIALSTKEANNG